MSWETEKTLPCVALKTSGAEPSAPPGHFPVFLPSCLVAADGAGSSAPCSALCFCAQGEAERKARAPLVRWWLWGSPASLAAPLQCDEGG